MTIKPSSELHSTPQAMSSTRAPCRRIATEEAFAVPTWLDAMSSLSVDGSEANEVRFLRFVQSIGEWRQGLIDFDHRLKIMDDCGVDMHLLSLTTPGVQSFAPDQATAIARAVNDELAGIVARYPGRFAGLATVAPQQRSEEHTSELQSR